MYSTQLDQLIKEFTHGMEKEIGSKIFTIAPFPAGETKKDQLSLICVFQDRTVLHALADIVTIGGIGALKVRGHRL